MERRMRMSEIVTLELPEHVVRSAQAVAARTNRRVEEVLVDWINQAATEVPIDSLSDEDQNELSDLLARNREGQRDNTDHARLDALMQVYRRGIVRKAQAWKVAAALGLRTALT